MSKTGLIVLALVGVVGILAVLVWGGAAHSEPRVVLRSGGNLGCCYHGW